MLEEEVFCDICGESHKLKFVHTLQCNHSYHYECIQKSFLYDRKRHNQCPLCRKPAGLLPLVNGLPKLIKGIHYEGCLPCYESTKCCELLKSGNRKGQPCNSKCMLGFSICKRHHTSKLKQESKKELNKKKVVYKINEMNDMNKIKITINHEEQTIKLGDALEQVQVEQLLYVTGNINA